MNYYNEIKNELLNNEIYKKVKDYSINKNDLKTYYNVGKLLVDAQGGEEKAVYGNKLIKDYSKKLTIELGKGYSWRNLYNMRTYYIIFSKNKKLQTLSAKLTWSHITELIKLENNWQINYYINEVIVNNLSVRELRTKIKNNEYERLDEKTKEKLITKEMIEVQDFIKNPIIIKSDQKYEKITEKVLKEIILDDISSFLKELGNGFSFVDSEYKIKIGDRYNYIDLLLFNYIYNCFIVVELKVGELKKQHIGQIQVYMNYIDDNLKTINQDKTIGLILCKKNNKYIIKYSSDKRICSATYELSV